VKRLRTTLGALALALLGGVARAETRVDDATLRRALTDELGRSVQLLSLPGEARAHFVAYTALDSELSMVMATHGSVTFESEMPSRSLDVTLRVGTPELDSSGPWSSSFRPIGTSSSDDDYAAIRRELWLASDIEYKGGLEALAQKKTALSARVDERKDSYPDFAAEPRHDTVLPLRALDRSQDEQKLRTLAERLSRSMAEAPRLLDSSAWGQVVGMRRRLLTSEQTWADEAHRRVRLSAYAVTQADDGMQLSESLEFTSDEVSKLPPIETIEAQARSTLARLEAFRNAPLAESGSAVVLFEERAAAQLVRSLLARRVSGTPPQRYVAADTDRSLASRLGLEIVSPLLDVVSDPTLAQGPRGQSLWGSYAADDEGVPARRVSLIERGVLKTLLMSRSPRKEIRQSNGHFRLGRGASIANLVVETRRPLTRPKLIELAQREAKKHGPATRVYVVRRLAPRHSFGMRGMLAMAGDEAVSVEQGVVAAEAYLVDGKQERPVRGLTLDGMELRALKDVLGVGGEPYVLNLDQTSGASVVTPALLLGDIDVKRHEADNPKPPSYPAPSAPAAAKVEAAPRPAP
jgi:TldD protein